jgi:hypothetical protein
LASSINGIVEISINAFICAKSFVKLKTILAAKTRKR